MLRWMVRREPYGDYEVRRVAGRRQDTFPLRSFVHRAGVRVPLRQIILFHRYQPNLPERTQVVGEIRLYGLLGARETREFEERRIGGEIYKRVFLFLFLDPILKMTERKEEKGSREIFFVSI